MGKEERGTGIHGSSVNYHGPADKMGGKTEEGGGGQENRAGGGPLVTAVKRKKRSDTPMKQRSVIKKVLA